MTHFLPATVVLAWLSSSLLTWNGVSSLLILTTLCVCEIRLADVVISLNILFGCSQKINAWNVITNFFNFSTIYIMHLVACQTPHLLFSALFRTDLEMNLLHRSRWSLLLLFCLSLCLRWMPSCGICLISCEILDSRSECSFLLSWYLPLSLLMPWCSRAEQILFQCGLTELSLHFWYGYFPMLSFLSASYAPEFGHLSNPELSSTILQTSDYFLKVLIGNVGIWTEMSWRTSW